MQMPSNPQEGDMCIDPVEEKVFYYTGGMWLDITTKDKREFTTDDKHPN